MICIVKTITNTTTYAIRTLITYGIQLFHIIITIGAATGTPLTNASIDIVLHDAYYVIGSSHLVLSVGALTSLQQAIQQHIQYYTSNTELN